MVSRSENAYVLIEDASVQEQIEAILRNLGFEYQTLTRLEHLKEALTQNQSFIVFVQDELIGDPDRFLSWLHENSSTLFPILISPNTSAQQALHWINRGGFACYEPPLTRNQIIQKLRPLLTILENQEFLLETHRNLNEKLKEETEDLARQASHDGLTGLPNKSHFESKAETHLQKAMAQRRPISFLMIDIDGFKSYNDEHGHRAGDKALEQVGELIRKEIRNNDLAGRLGGEEFGILLPGTDQHGAFVTAERLRNSVQNHRFPVQNEKNSAGLTISIGISAHPDHVSTVEELFEVADRALYQSKEQGRNRSTMSEMYNFQFEEPEDEPVHSVSVVGDFNEWAPNSEPLDKQGESRWVKKLAVPRGPLRYAFCINGEQFVPDNHTNRTVKGPEGREVTRVVV